MSLQLQLTKGEDAETPHASTCKPAVRGHAGHPTHEENTVGGAEMENVGTMWQEGTRA